MMTAMGRVVVVGAVLCLVAFGAYGDVITIDGDSSDWSSPDSMNDDANEAGTTDAWDIDENWYEWDQANVYMCFAYITYDDINTTPGGDYSYILLDVPPLDVAAGTPVTAGPTDIDYYLSWLMDGDSPKLYEWTGTAFSEVTGADVSMALGTGSDANFVEWRVDARHVGLPGKFEWGAYLDDGGGSADDYCPDSYEQGGRTPEPTTMLLLPIGLAALGVWRRNKSA